MSELYGVNYTKYNSGFPADIIARGQGGGILQCISDTYEASSTTAEDTVAIGHDLNAGDVVLFYILSSDDCGNDNAIDIGDSNDPNRYADGIDNESAVSGNKAIFVDGMGYVIGTNSGDETILLTLTDNAHTGTIKISIFYCAA